MATLEDFESGSVDDAYSETVGDGWTVQAINRSTGFAQPTFRPLPDPDTTVPPASISTTQGVRFNGSSAWSLAVDYEVCAGLGGYFYSDAAAPGAPAASSLIVSIGFVNEQAAGSLLVDRRGNTLHINEFYDDLSTYVDNDSTVTLTDFLDTGGETPSGVWLEVSLTKSGGWDVKNGTTGATLAHGAYPYAIPRGAPWDLSMQPNSSGPSGASGSVVVYADNVYGFAGSLTAPAVRMFPREDGRGMSSAPRIHPAPRSGRIIGGHQ